KLAKEVILLAPCSPHLQPHVEHHGGDDVEVGEVDAELPGQVEEDEEGPGQPLAEHPVGPGRGRLGEPGSQGGQNRRHIPPARGPAAPPGPRSRPLPAPGGGCRQRGGALRRDDVRTCVIPTPHGGRARRPSPSPLPAAHD
uniref:Uncharacterized protein n=1 Tax=Aquila chrysaetos chrysaetos TaxID=223781 RepID=A0A663ELC2_AQUCH